MSERDRAYGESMNPSPHHRRTRSTRPSTRIEHGAVEGLDIQEARPLLDVMIGTMVRCPHRAGTVEVSALRHERNVEGAQIRPLCRA